MTPAKRGKGAKPKVSAEQQENMPVQRRAAMTWAQRLKRVFGIETCPACGGALRIIACIEDPVVIKTTAGMQEVEQRREQLPKILTHLDKQDPSVEVSPLPPCRAPPQDGLFD